MNGHDLRLELVKLAHDATAPFELVIDRAKALETYVWGATGPVEKAPTAFSTIEEAANATRERLTSIALTLPEDMKARLQAALPHFERFIAEVNSILQPGA